MKRLLLLVIFILPCFVGAQNRQSTDLPDSTSRKVVYDRPDKIRRFFFGLQPVYADAFASGVNAGFGLEAFYLPKQGKADFRASLRRPYSTKFFDQTADDMNKNSGTLNESVRFMWFETGVNFHLSDEIKSSVVKVALVKNEKSSSQMQWPAARTVLIPGNVRTIKGIRAGFAAWRSAVDVTRILTEQGSRNADVALPEELLDQDGNATPFIIFSNLYTRSFYAGLSYTRIQNQSVLFNDYQTAVNDKILNAYVDFMYAPWMSLDEAAYGLTTYELLPVEFNKFGFRLGLDVKSNRKLGWSYGAEIGSRPAPSKSTSFFLLKIAVPVFAGYLVNRD